VSIRLLHAADIHLGYQQYGSPQRYHDFALAFGHLVDDALAQRVDYVLVAGDLFHQRTVDPLTLLQATDHLRRLRDAGIPVIAVEGNHERPHYLDKLSWLGYLAKTGLLIVLTPEYHDGTMVLEPWNERDRTGAYIDLPGGLRVIGAKYYGATTARVLQDLGRAIPELPGGRPAYTVLMLHAGIQGVLDHYPATVSRAQLDVLRPYADYVALGHIHKPFIQDDWVYNPGSIETVSMSEADWDDRGYFLVDVDPAMGRHVVTCVRSRRRPFERLSFAVDYCHGPEEFYTGLARFLGERATPERAAAEPVVELNLFGALGFDRTELDLGRLEAMASEAFHAIVCRVRDTTDRSPLDIRMSEGMSRADLERHVLSQLIKQDGQHQSDSAAWADLTLRLKQLALADSRPEEIIAELRAFPVVAPPEGPPDASAAACVRAPAGGPSGGVSGVHEAPEDGGEC